MIPFKMFSGSFISPTCHFASQATDVQSLCHEMPCIDHLQDGRPRQYHQASFLNEWWPQSRHLWFPWSCTWTHKVHLLPPQGCRRLASFTPTSTQQFPQLLQQLPHHLPPSSSPNWRCLMLEDSFFFPLRQIGEETHHAPGFWGSGNFMGNGYHHHLDCCLHTAPPYLHTPNTSKKTINNSHESWNMHQKRT